MGRALCVLLLSAFIFNLSAQANDLTTPLPKAEKSLTLTYIQNEASCTYVVAINTSCSSSMFTRNNISIAFGDDSGNQIYVPSLEGPSTSTFKPCSSDIFVVKGPCAKQICYEYLYQTGPDDWVPETVKIYGGHTRAVTFVYNTSVPKELWYGHSLCSPPTFDTPPPPPPPHIFPPFVSSPPPPHSPPYHQPPPPPPPSSSYRGYAPAGWFTLISAGLVYAFFSSP